MTPSQVITAEHLLDMNIEQPCELIAGQLVMLPYSGCEHGAITVAISSLLKAHVLKNANGFDVLPGVGFVICRGPDTVRAPDIAVVRKDRRPKLPDDYVSGPPDLAVEVVSHMDRGKDVDEKAHAWLDAGTPMVWVVWPSTRSVIVHRAGQPPRILNKPDVITGEEVLPGFECRVEEFFSD